MNEKFKLAILDDDQQVITEIADWSALELSCKIHVLDKHLETPEEAIDYDCNQTGQMLAALLVFPKPPELIEVL